jgi:hypothetical protein
MLNLNSWTPNTILSIKLKDNLFTLAQMRENHLMQFFNIQNNNGNWHDADLNLVEPLFCIYVAESRIKLLFDSIVTHTSIKPNGRPTPKWMLSAFPIIDSKYKCRVDLIELDDNYDSTESIVIRENLLPTKDTEELQRFELDGMWGNPQKLAKRLIHYFDNGFDWDETKSFIFGNDWPPPSPRQ